MPRTPASTAIPLRRGATAAVVVLGAHWALLATPVAWSAAAARAPTPPQSLELRLVSAPPSPPLPAAWETPAPAPRLQRRHPQPSPAAQENTASARVVIDNDATKTIAHQNPETAPEVLQIAAATPAPAPAATSAAAPSPASAPPAASAPSPAPTLGAAAGSVALPNSVRLLYDIKGEMKRFPVSAQGTLDWRQDGKTYDARLEIRLFLLGSRVQTSKGLIGVQGLEPIRFGDKVRSEVAAHFERSKGKVSYSANTPDEALQSGAQDQLSIFFQLAGLLAAQPQRYGVGSALSFQAVGPRSSENWVFKVAAPLPVALPGGQVRAIQLTKEPVHEHDSRAEVWLAPDLEYLPVRIRLTQSNGDFVDQLWRATERP